MKAEGKGGGLGALADLWTGNWGREEVMICYSSVDTGDTRVEERHFTQRGKNPN